MEAGCSSSLTDLWPFVPFYLPREDRRVRERRLGSGLWGRGLGSPSQRG